jgi:hypothetical protein
VGAACLLMWVLLARHPSATSGNQEIQAPDSIQLYGTAAYRAASIVNEGFIISSRPPQQAASQPYSRYGLLKYCYGLYSNTVLAPVGPSIRLHAWLAHHTLFPAGAPWISLLYFKMFNHAKTLPTFSLRKARQSGW